MIKKLFYLFIFILVINCSGCAKKEAINVPVESVMEKIKSEVSLKNTAEQNLTDLAYAKKYGLSVSEIEEGLAYITTDINLTDEILLIKAKTDEDVQNIQRVLNSEVDKLAGTWEKTSKEEYEKINNHVLKTRGKYVLLAVTDEAKKVENIFDSMV